MNGSARRSGNRPISARAGPIPATGWPMPRGEEPIKAVWSLAARNGRALCRRAAGRPVPQRRWRPVLEPCRGAAASTRPGRNGSPGGAGLILHSLVPHPDDPGKIWVGISAAGVFHTADGGETWETAQPRHPLRFPARGPALSRIRPMRALPGDGAGHDRAALPAEPLRHVSQRRWRPALGQHRGGAALELRLPGRGPSARPRHAVPAAAQRRHQGPLRAGRQGRGLAHARRRRQLAGPAPRPAAGERLFRRAAPGHGDRPAGPGRGLFRHPRRRAVRQRRRGRELGLHRRSICRRSCRSRPWWSTAERMAEPQDRARPCWCGCRRC